MNLENWHNADDQDILRRKLLHRLLCLPIRYDSKLSNDFRILGRFLFFSATCKVLGAPPIFSLGRFGIYLREHNLCIPLNLLHAKGQSILRALVIFPQNSERRKNLFADFLPCMDDMILEFVMIHKHTYENIHVFTYIRHGQTQTCNISFIIF